MEHIREGKHGARSPQQAIAIGLSKARRAGVKLPPPQRGSAGIKKQAAPDLRKGKSRRKPSPRRSRAVEKARKSESRRSASHEALSRQARSAARRRSKASRSRAAKKAARTRKQKRYRAICAGDPVIPSVSPGIPSRRLKANFLGLPRLALGMTKRRGATSAAPLRSRIDRPLFGCHRES